MLSRPDVLVLGGGGVLGEAWTAGVLAGIEDGTGFDLRRCEHFVGTSAGSIVAARLVAGETPRRPARISAGKQQPREQPPTGRGPTAADPRRSETQHRALRRALRRTATRCRG
jgi:NTE family protein